MPMPVSIVSYRTEASGGIANSTKIKVSSAGHVATAITSIWSLATAAAGARFTLRSVPPSMGLGLGLGISMGMGVRDQHAVNGTRELCVVAAANFTTVVVVIVAAAAAAADGIERVLHAGAGAGAGGIGIAVPSGCVF